MNRDQALEKIKKCLRLSKSSNEHEAAAALRQAQTLMREHGVSATDVQLSDVIEHKTRARSSTTNRWEALLARTVAEAFGCEWFSVIRRELLPGLALRKVRDVVFIGVGSSAEVAAYSYDVLQRQLVRARGAHVAKQPASCKPITKTARGDQFALGWVCAVADLVERFAGNDAERLLIEQYMATKHPNLTSSKPRDRAVGRNVRSDDFGAGVRAGQGARLDRGIGAREGPKLLGGASA
jgi:hypothetical protein